MNHRLILFLILGMDAIILLFKTSELSLSYSESLLLYGDASLIQLIIKTSIHIFGENDFALRFPMILFHLLSALLLYSISRRYVSQTKNRLWLVLVFALLPGVISSAIVVNSAGVVIFELLLFLYVYQKFDLKYSYLLLLVYSLIEGDFLYLFFALTFFSIYQKDYKFFAFNALLTLISLYLYGIDVLGSPSGHFLDTLGIYSAVFTPIVFIYLFFVLYRRLLVKDIDVIWFIASVTLVLSLVLSFRQRIYIENFAPYMIMALPLAAQTFYSSYRVRLRNFRTNYKIIFISAILFLFANALVVLFNKEIYRFLDNPKKHFAYKTHIAKELAMELKKRDIHCVSSSKKMSNRLKFYGINSCKEYRLSKISLNSSELGNVTVSYVNRVVYKANVTKINSD